MRSGLLASINNTALIRGLYIRLAIHDLVVLGSISALKVTEPLLNFHLLLSTAVALRITAYANTLREAHVAVILCSLGIPAFSDRLAIAEGEPPALSKQLAYCLFKDISNTCA